MKTFFGRLDPLNDYLFLKVMGEKGDEVQLLGFLNAALGRTGNDRIVSVEIIENKSLTPDFLGDKGSVLDVRAKLRDGTRVNIEVQLCKRSNFEKRSLFYWSREYTRGIKKGGKHHALPTVICINIIGFEFLETENYHTIFHLREDSENHLVLTDVLEIHFISMVKWEKLQGKDTANDPLHRWLTYFDKNSPPELVEEVVNMDTAIRAANDRQVYVSGDEEAIRAYEMRELAEWDWNNSLEYARDEGIAEGMKEGKIEIARKLKAMGIPAEQINEATGLDLQTIEKLK
jgi:predicted transposase/invertase (TIGR01784 family)